MKKKFFPVLIMISIATSVIFMSCSKSSGPQGETGPAGPAGQPGPQGVAGNANVKVDTFTITSGQWSANLGSYSLSTSTGGYTTYFTRYYDAPFTQVTSDILNTGMVLAFFRPSDADPAQWSPLPYSFVSFGSDYNFNFVYETSVGNVRINFFFTKINPAATPPNISTYTPYTYKFKLVAVSGIISTRLKEAHVDLQNYEQVSKYINL